MLTRKKRVLIILQLIFSLSFLIWLVIRPYVMEVVIKKSHIALYEMVMEHKALFESLPSEERNAIVEGYTNRSFPSYKVHTSPFALAWIFFSLLICLLLLFHIEGAVHAAWLLPVLTLCYSYFITISPPEKFVGLFPSENYVRENYITETGNSRELLLKGWHHYLIQEWAHEYPSSDAALYEQQLNKGLFAFNIARLHWIQTGKGDEVVIAGFLSPPSLLRLLTYFLWNLLFAWLITRRLPSAAASNQN